LINCAIPARHDAGEKEFAGAFRALDDAILNRSAEFPRFSASAVVAAQSARKLKTLLQLKKI
jgi:hypothetical protein